MLKAARWGALVVLSAFVLAGTAGVAGAQDGTDPYVGPSPTVSPEVVDRGVPAEVQGQSVSAAPATEVRGAVQVRGSSLAFTGGDVVALVGVGLAAVAAGGLLLASRRRATA